MNELTERITAQVGLDPLELVEEVRAANMEYKRQAAYVEQLDHGRKVVISELTETHRTIARKAGEKVTEGRLDHLARADKAYKDYLRTMLSEKRRLAELEAEYYGLRNRLEVVQALISYAQTEMRVL